MPEPAGDEEKETRQHATCMFGQPGFTNKRRCPNCPGAARNPCFSCTLDRIDEKDEENGKLLLASSSNASDEDNTYNTSDTYLKSGTKRKAALPPSSPRDDVTDPQRDGFSGVVESTPDNPPSGLEPTETLPGDSNSLTIDMHSNNESEDSSVSSPNVDISNELATENVQLESHLSGGTKFNWDQLDGRSDVEEYLNNKQPKKFQDNEPLPFHPWCWKINTETPASLNTLLTMTPDNMSMELPSGSVSSFNIHIPGATINPNEPGVLSCSDGIFNGNDPMDLGLMALLEIEHDHME